MTKRGRKLWVKLESPNGQMRAFITRDMPRDETGEEVHATYDRKTGEVEVWDGLSDDQKKSALLHEIKHKAWELVPPDTQKRILLGDGDLDEKEEEMIAHQEPHEFDIYNRNKLLRFPKPPKF